LIEPIKNLVCLNNSARHSDYAIILFHADYCGLYFIVRRRLDILWDSQFSNLLHKFGCHWTFHLSWKSHL